tara:strand:- start:490 stop:600 length:111 start_codon:yes stop_codon:yes gene_type:complete
MLKTIEVLPNADEIQLPIVIEGGKEETSRAKEMTGC